MNLVCRIFMGIISSAFTLLIILTFRPAADAGLQQILHQLPRALFYNGWCFVFRRDQPDM
jgi:hypothetical protein